MLIDTQNLVSMTEANQNFSRVAHLVDERGSVVILRNNQPRYLLLDYAIATHEDTLSDAEVDSLGQQLIEQYRPVFEALAQ